MTDQTTTIPADAKAMVDRPKGWKMTTLGEVATFCYGKMPGKDRVTLSGKYPVYSGYQTIGYYDEFNSDEDLIVVARGVGGTGDVKISPKKSFITNLSIIVKVNEVKLDSKYLFYKYSVKNLRYLDSGSAQSQIVISDLKNIQLLLPPLPEQRAIAAVLSSLDDKIELLREQNKTLEATAQAIFKEWFVRFNFPNENGEPYATAGGTMIDSLSACGNAQAGELGQIPEGWRVGRLGEVTDIRGGTTPSTKNPDFWNGDIAWTSPKDLSNTNEIFLLKTEKKITKDGLRQISSGLLPKGTLLLTSRAPIGYLSISDLEIAINQGYIAFLPNKYFSNYFMYLWLRTNMQAVINASNGSTFLEISKSSFRNISCLIPNKDVLKSFNNVAAPFFTKILSNIHQIQTLSTIRDTLLPKLMKGELRVEGFKE
jgi:type I restriction enzyme S subunit